MAIRNLHWELEATFTRKQVIAMSKVAPFVANIEKQLSNDFPSSCKNVDWGSFREVMGLFSSLGDEDHLCYRALVKTVQDVQEGKVQILAGKVVVESEPRPEPAPATID